MKGSALRAEGAIFQVVMGEKLKQVARRIRNDLDQMQREFDSAAIDAFELLELMDPETATLAIEAFDDRRKAALWFASHIGSLGGKRPWQLLAAGRATPVRRVLNSIIHGLPA